MRNDSPYIIQSHSSVTRGLVLHVLRHKWLLATFVIGTFATSALVSLLAVVIGSLFDKVSPLQLDQPRLVWFCAQILAILAGRLVVDVVRRCAIELLGKRLERDVRDELYRSLLEKSQTFHNRQQVGDLMAHTSNDVFLVQSILTPGFDLIFTAISDLIIPLIFIAFLGFDLLLSPLVFVVAFGLSLRQYVRKLDPVTEEHRRYFSAMNACAAETIRGIEVVKSFAQERQEQEKFAFHTERYRDAYIRHGSVQARYLPTLLLSMVTTVAFAHGAWKASHGTMSSGDFVAYMGLMATLFLPTNLSVSSFAQVRLGLAAGRRIHRLMAEEVETPRAEAGYQGQIRGEICFDQVSFGYGQQPQLKNISFHVCPGQTVAIVGETGAGKSTLVKLINRIYDVQSGQISIDGVDVNDWDISVLRSQIAVIEQDIVLFSRSIAENIGFGLSQQATPAAIQEAAALAQAHGFISQLPEGYATVIGERGTTLSGGQRQRLAIARALLTDPRILIIDDATSAIDSATEAEIQRAMTTVMQQRTVLLITHRLALIRQADLVLVLHKGAVIDQGSHAELVGRCPMYRRLFVR